MYKYTDKSYIKEAFYNKHGIQLSTNKAYTCIKMTQISGCNNVGNVMCY